ncbi:type II toxin-antitoxin system PemK/MazF family toxin [Photobacterium frigidiphilum]
MITGPKNQRELALDQIRAVDKSRVIKQLGKLRTDDQDSVYAVLKELLV